MIFGSVKVENNAVVTHNTSYALDNIAAVSARRPLLAGGVMAALGSVGTTLAFGDLLYTNEIVTIGIMGIVGLVIGWCFGQLKLHSLALKGNEVSGVLYGTYNSLNRVRREIDAQLRQRRDRETG
ncbi:MAG: DUF6232 family protein [Pseudomonadota bacterium]